jgi:hypothetical protein
MNLFELFESPVIAGANNLKAIANAATTSTDATITLGGEPVNLEYPEARFVYGLYKKSLQNGRQEQFMQMLADPRSFDQLMAGMRNMLYKDRGPEMAQAAAQRIGQPGVQEAVPMVEAAPEQNDTLAHIVKRFPKEVKDFARGAELSDELYHALYDYYFLHGEMPYGTAKGRDGDPYEWIHQRFDQDVHDYITESITEGKKKVVAERWDDEDEDDWYGFNDKSRKAATGGTVTKTSTGVVHKGKYGSEFQGDDGDEEDYDEWGNKKPGTSKKAKAAAAALAQPDAPKRGRGRPSQGVQATDAGFAINDHGVWYRKVKRSHPEVKMFGSRDKSIAIVQKGNKNYVAGTWSGSKGEIATKLSATVPTASLSDYKSARGRPRTRAESAMMPRGRTRPVREFIEQLRCIAEGYKTREEIRSVL